MVVLKILSILFITLIILVTLLERFGKPMSEEEQSKISRWVLPMCMLLAVLGLLRYSFG